MSYPHGSVEGQAVVFVYEVGKLKEHNGNGGLTDDGKKRIFDDLSKKYIDYPCQYCERTDAYKCTETRCIRWLQWFHMAWKDIQEAAKGAKR